jgi:hypothetical protein
MDDLDSGATHQRSTPPLTIASSKTSTDIETMALLFALSLRRCPSIFHLAAIFGNKVTHLSVSFPPNNQYPAHPIHHVLIGPDDDN